MYRLATKCTTKNEASLRPNTATQLQRFLSTAVSRHSAVRCDRRLRGVCRDSRLQCTCRGVRTANLHAVRSAITATAELLVEKGIRNVQ